MSSEHRFYTKQIVLWTKKYFNHPGLDISDDTQDNKTSCSRPRKVYATVDGDIRSCLPDFSAINIQYGIHHETKYSTGQHSVAKTVQDF